MEVGTLPPEGIWINIEHKEVTTEYHMAKETENPLTKQENNTNWLKNDNYLVAKHP